MKNTEHQNPLTICARCFLQQRKQSHQDAALLESFFFFFPSFVAVDGAVQAHDMLFSTVPAEVFLLTEVCLSTGNKNLCTPVLRQTGVLKDKQE